MNLKELSSLLSYLFLLMEKTKVKNGNAIFPVEWVADKLVEILKDEKRKDEIVVYPGNEGFGKWVKPK